MMVRQYLSRLSDLLQTCGAAFTLPGSPIVGSLAAESAACCSSSAGVAQGLHSLRLYHSCNNFRSQAFSTSVQHAGQPQLQLFAPASSQRQWQHLAGQQARWLSSQQATSSATSQQQAAAGSARRQPLTAAELGMYCVSSRAAGRLNHASGWKQLGQLCLVSGKFIAITDAVAD
jgi:hypothetical protein